MVIHAPARRFFESPYSNPSVLHVIGPGRSDKLTSSFIHDVNGPVSTNDHLHWRLSFFRQGLCPEDSLATGSNEQPFHAAAPQVHCIHLMRECQKSKRGNTSDSNFDGQLPRKA